MIVSVTILITLHINSTLSFFIKGASAGNHPVTEAPAEFTNYTTAISQDFSLDEENYIDDIPFNTETISAQSKYEKAVSVEFSFEEEELIDDTIF